MIDNFEVRATECEMLNSKITLLGLEQKIEEAVLVAKEYKEKSESLINETIQFISDNSQDPERTLNVISVREIQIVIEARLNLMNQLLEGLAEMFEKENGNKIRRVK